MKMAIDESDLAARLMEDMDARLLDFLKNQVNSFVKWDLVRFFHENPNTADTADNIARYAGRDPAAIERELAQLADSGVLEGESVGELTVYSLATDDDMRALIDQFVAACNDRQFRVKAIYHIIRGMR
jgi:predicted transcriptional regulator